MNTKIIINCNDDAAMKIANIIKILEIHNDINHIAEIQFSSAYLLEGIEDCILYNGKECNIDDVFIDDETLDEYLEDPDMYSEYLLKLEHPTIKEIKLEATSIQHAKKLLHESFGEIKILAFKEL